MTNTTISTPAFTFRASWYKAINCIKSKSMRNRLIMAITEYAFTHTFTLTGNSTFDSLMILFAESIDNELNRDSGIIEPEENIEQTSASEPIPTPKPEPMPEQIVIAESDPIPAPKPKLLAPSASFNPKILKYSTPRNSSVLKMSKTLGRQVRLRQKRV